MPYKVQATAVRPGHRVQIPGLRNYYGEDIGRKFFEVKDTVRRAISVVLIFDPSEEGPPETVTVRADRGVIVHRQSA